MSMPTSSRRPNANREVHRPPIAARIQSSRGVMAANRLLFLLWLLWMTYWRLPLVWVQDRLASVIDLGRRSHRVPTSSRAGTTTRLEFTEEMHSYVDFGQTDFWRGALDGRDDGNRLTCHLTIGIDDLTRFVADPDHQARLHGWVDCEALGGRRPIQHGAFKLFVDAPQDAPGHQRMTYRMAITDGADHPLTLSGHKLLRPDSTVGVGVWRDTTTLYLHVLGGDSPPQEGDGTERAPIVAAGILRLSIAGFLKQLTTVRVHADSFAAGLIGLERFARLFLGDLWNLHGRRSGSAGSSWLAAQGPRP